MEKAFEKTRIEVWIMGEELNNLNHLGLSQCCARIAVIENGKAVIFKALHVVEKGNEDYGKMRACSKVVTKMIEKYKFFHEYPL